MDNNASKNEDSMEPNFKTGDEILHRARRKSITFPAAANIHLMMKRWRSVCAQRRKLPKTHLRHSSGMGKSECNEKSLSILIENDLKQGEKPPRLFGRDVTDLTNPLDLNRCLLRYFVRVSDCKTDMFSNELDIEFIVKLLSRGADLNARDKYRQTVLHEVARNWGTEVMEQMAQTKGNVNAADYRGWTPLHVAAASDYPEMCRTLVRLGADMEAEASNKQTPLFFAARTDSARSLRALIKLGCNLKALDYRGRSPLFVACELDRSATAAILLEHGADAFMQDNTGQIAFVPLLEKMPPLAAQALEPLHEKFRITRKQRLNLFKLDPKEVIKPDLGDGVTSTSGIVKRVPYHSTMKAIIETHNFQLMGLQIIRLMIGEQWLSYGRIRAIGQVILQLINIILWTVFAVAKEWAERFKYDLPADIYRIPILIAACAITGYLIIEEILEYTGAQKRLEAWQKWKKKNIQEDQKHLHEGHPLEKDYLESEIMKVEDESAPYFSDWWNYLDIVCYIFIALSLILHFVDVGYPGGEGNLVVARYHVRFMALSIVLLWLRLLKYVKPFEFFGPFIVMLGMILGDLLKFLLLYLEFFIPFACIFWTILGDKNNVKDVDAYQSVTLKNYTRHNFTRVTVDYMDSFHNTMFTLFRLTLVDEYDYSNMVAIDSVTAQILLGAWFSISTILFLNLFIAQLSETFKSVFDNAKAAATMQKAITLMHFYETMSMSSKVKYHTYLKKDCNPKSIDYDDDVTNSSTIEEQQKATIQIRDMVEIMHSKISRLHAKEILQPDSDENDISIDNDSSKGIRTKRRSKHLAEKATNNVKYRLQKLEAETKSELISIKQMLRDVAIVVSGITRDASTMDTASSQVAPDSDNEDGGAGPRVGWQSGSGGGITEVEPMAPSFQRNNI